MKMSHFRSLNSSLRYISLEDKSMHVTWTWKLKRMKRCRPLTIYNCDITEVMKLCQGFGCKGCWDIASRYGRWQDMENTKQIILWMGIFLKTILSNLLENAFFPNTVYGFSTSVCFHKFPTESTDNSDPVLLSS